MINIPKGTKDVLPFDTYKWKRITKVAYEIAHKYNLKEIKTPTFEHTELFRRGVGEGSDIVNKEMYTFLDKGGRSLTLKPEGTASVARSFIENGLFNEVMPLKMWYITPCFRYERPQAGRLREHHQFAVEVYGPNSVMSDVETILIAYEFYRAFGIEPTLHINNIGCEHCRKDYIEKLREYAKPHLQEMCEDCRVRYEKNPLRMLDCKVDVCKDILKDAPLISDTLCDNCKNHFEQVKALLDVLKVNYVADPMLVRGIDYYTNIVFEFVDDDKLLGQNALGGGGRYNNLVEELGGKPTPVIGFGIGLERLLAYMEKKNIEMPNDERVDVYIASNTTNDSYIMYLAQKLRNMGFTVESDLMLRSLKAQFKYADKLDVKYVIIVGEDEIFHNELSIKNMETGEQLKVPYDKLEEFFSNAE
ncbi:MAG: histidine--tRNA ligase [Clostridia bacterium]|nr:histidine--tRNA ligase [Clostridia bacterium]